MPDNETILEKLLLTWIIATSVYGIYQGYKSGQRLEHIERQLAVLGARQTPKSFSVNNGSGEGDRIVVDYGDVSFGYRDRGGF